MGTNLRKIINSLFVAVAAFVFACSCEEPDKGMEFIRGHRTVYEFTLKDVDTLSFYDIYLYTNPKNRNVSIAESLPLQIRWTSERCDVYVEDVWMKLSSRKQEYREGMSFPESGTWKMSVYVQSSATDKINGLGITWRRYGTR